MDDLKYRIGRTFGCPPVDPRSNRKALCAALAAELRKPLSPADVCFLCAWPLAAEDERGYPADGWHVARHGAHRDAIEACWPVAFAAGMRRAAEIAREVSEVTPDYRGWKDASETIEENILASVWEP